MTVVNEAQAFTKSVLGVVVRKTQALSAASLPVFTIAGGEVMVTSVWVKATVAISTDGGTLALANNPTTGDTVTLVTATNLGTTDTAIGTIVGLDQGTTAASSFLRGGRHDVMWVVGVGQLELVGASAVNGTVEIGVTYVPLTDGATLVAA